MTVFNFLDEITDPAAQVRAFYLREDAGSRLNAALIVFTPEGVAIMGDYTPGHHGAVSALGYGIEWFAKPHNADYLAGKFLQQSFRPDLAVQWLRSLIPGHPEDEVLDIEELCHALEDGSAGWESVGRLANELGLYEDLIHDVSLTGFDQHEVKLLCAIQRDFARLYALTRGG